MIVIIIRATNYWALTMCSSSFFSSSPRNRHFIPFFFFDNKSENQKASFIQSTDIYGGDEPGHCAGYREHK